VDRVAQSSSVEDRRRDACPGGMLTTAFVCCGRPNAAAGSVIGQGVRGEFMMRRLAFPLRNGQACPGSASCTTFRPSAQPGPKQILAASPRTCAHASDRPLCSLAADERSMSCR